MASGRVREVCGEPRQADRLRVKTLQTVIAWAVLFFEDSSNFDTVVDLPVSKYASKAELQGTEGYALGTSRSFSVRSPYCGCIQRVSFFIRPIAHGANASGLAHGALLMKSLLTDGDVASLISFSRVVWMLPAPQSVAHRRKQWKSGSRIIPDH